jgi:hypothetical protein
MMTILISPNSGDITYNDFTYNDFTFIDFTYNDFTYNDFTIIIKIITLKTGDITYIDI